MKLAAFVVAALVSLPQLAGAQDACVVHGRILGYDGRPLPKARARAIEPGARSAITDRDGWFTLRLTRPGYHLLDIDGVYHQSLLLPAFVEPTRPLEVEIRLQTVAYRDHFDSVGVIGEFNGYSATSPIPMARRPDGTFAATIPCSAESLRYQLTGIARDGRPTAGTEADTFFVRDRWICSLRAGHQPVALVFEPARLPRSEAKPVVQFADPRSESARLAPLFAEEIAREEKLGRASQARKAAGGDPSEFKWDWAADARRIQEQMAREGDPLRRQYLFMNYSRYAGADSDSVMALRALREIPPDSWAWSLVPGGPGGVMFWARKGSRRPDLAMAYLELGSETHPDSSVRAGFLNMAIAMADEAGDKERVGRLFTRMMDEFRGSPDADWTRIHYAPDRAVREGQPVPEFAFSGLEDSTVIYRPADFRGHYLLIDFWAVWCGPCLGEMRSLHDAYAAYKGRGLTVLSVSFDPRRADVTKFRGGKWPMPWLHAFASQGFSGVEAKRFGVLGIPRPILVDPEGKIVAMENDLRGDRLEPTLARLLGPGTNVH